MATIQHKNITDPDIHEPKGVAASSVDTVYVSGGAGTGTWKQAPYYYTLNVQLADLSTASSCYVVAPVAGKIKKIYSVIQNAITVTDSVVTSYINATPVTSGTITVAFTGSAAGDVDSCTPSAANTVAAGDKIVLTTDGASTTTCITNFTIQVAVGYA